MPGGPWSEEETREEGESDGLVVGGLVVGPLAYGLVDYALAMPATTGVQFWFPYGVYAGSAALTGVTFLGTPVAVAGMFAFGKARNTFNEHARFVNWQGHRGVAIDPIWAAMISADNNPWKPAKKHWTKWDSIARYNRRKKTTYWQRGAPAGFLTPPAPKDWLYYGTFSVSTRAPGSARRVYLKHNREGDRFRTIYPR